MVISVGIKLSSEGAQAVQSDLAKVAEGQARLEAQTRRTASAAESMAGTLRLTATAAAGFAMFHTAANYVRELAGEMLAAQIRAESLATGLSFAVAGSAGKEIDYLRSVTNRLGLEFHSTATAYMKFAAAARETRLEGEGARKVFEAVSKASVVMGLTADENQGVLLALSQMISKGTVQSEELRGQLGERLPGAFQIAARAIGVTTGELGKMLEQGQVVADEFLPKFAAQLEKELGSAAAKAGERTEASLNRTKNAWERVKQSFADSGISEALSGQLAIITDALDNVSGRMNTAKAAGDGFVGQMATAGVGILQFINPLNAFSYSAQGAAEQLKQAEAELQRLNKGLNQNPGNLFMQTAVRDAQALVDKLKEARDQKEYLSGKSQSQQMGDASKGIDVLAKAGLAEQARDEAALATIRGKLWNVSEDYLKTLTALQGLRDRGRIGEKEYIQLVSELATKTAKVKDTSKAQESAYHSLTTSIGEKIAVMQAEQVAGDKLTPMQKLQAETISKIDSSTVKLTVAQKLHIDGLLQQALALEHANDVAARGEGGMVERAKAHESEFVALMASTKALLDQTGEQVAANQSARTGIDFSGKLVVAKLREAAVTAELAAIKVEEKNADFALGEQYRANAKALAGLADAKAAAISGAVDDEARKSVDAFLDPTKAESFGDALRNAFGSSTDALLKLTDVMGD